MLRRSRVAKKKKSVQRARSERLQERDLGAQVFPLKSFQQRHSFNFTAKEVICRGKSCLLCHKSWEGKRSHLSGKAVCCWESRRSLVLRNISPRSYCVFITSLQGRLQQIKLESSGRPGKPKPEQVCGQEKSGYWSLEVLESSTGWSKGTNKELCFIRKVNWKGNYYCVFEEDNL